MLTPMDKRRLYIFIALAFGLAWAFGLIVAVTGGIADSPNIVSGSPITLASVLIAIGYMGSPAVANILTRIMTREGWATAGLRPNLKRGWKFWLAAWLLPPFITIFGAATFFLILPRYFDPGLGMISSMLESQGVSLPMSPLVILIVQLISGIFMAPLINSLFTFGEEFGWRGYLLPKLMPLSSHKAVIISGVIWGFWHAPVTAMGHNYGLDYPFFPWTGILLMTWFTILVGIFLAWVTLRAGSVWPAVIGHAVINGISGIGILASTSEPSTLLGPLPTGFLGGIGWLITAVFIYLSSKALAPAVDNPTDNPAAQLSENPT